MKKHYKAVNEIHRYYCLTSLRYIMKELSKSWNSGIGDGKHPHLKGKGIQWNWVYCSHKIDVTVLVVYEFAIICNPAGIFKNLLDTD